MDNVLEQHIGKATTEFGTIYYNKNDLYIGAEYSRNKHWDGEFITSTLSPYIKNAKTILDIGAHIGSHTIAYASINPTANIYSFEMQSEMFKLLTMNTNAKNIESQNQNQNQIKLFNNAVGNDNKLVEMDTGDPINSHQCCVFNYHSKPENNEKYNFGALSLGRGGNKTQMISIDSLQLEGCDFIKIDVEGFEYAVILCAINTIIKYKPIIYYEKNSRVMAPAMCIMANLPYRNSDIYNVERLLICLGYNKFTTYNDNILASIA